VTFYLKYRPQSVRQLDLTDVRERLSKILSAKIPPHAFLLTGPRGLGKTSAARIIAKTINCPKTKEIIPCNKCDICRSITSGINLDILEIDAASNRGIDEIRNLREKVRLASTVCHYKVYIIDEVHMLTTEAFNALLKTLEEPPAHVIFILATTQPDKVPDTIISRCFQVNFKKATPDEIKRSLAKISKGETLKIDDQALNEIIKYSDGSFREAAKIIEEVSFEGKTIKLKNVKNILGQDLKIDIDEFLQTLTQQNIAKSLTQIEKMSATQSNLRLLIRLVLETLHAHLLNLNGLEKHPSTKINFDSNQTIILINLFEKAHQEIKVAVIPTLPLELAVIDFCSQKISPSHTPTPTQTPTPTPTQTPTPTPTQTPTPTSTQTSSNSSKKTINKKPNPSPSPKSSAGFTLEEIASLWPKIIEAVKPYNHSVTALLRSSRPIDFSGNILTIEAFYQFHQERLSDPRVAQLVEKIVGEILESPIILKCSLGEKESLKSKSSREQKSAPSEDENDLVKYVEEVFN